MNDNLLYPTLWGNTPGFELKSRDVHVEYMKTYIITTIEHVSCLYPARLWEEYDTEQ